MTAPAWRTSGYSYGGGNCAEIGQEPGSVLVRDSKNPDGPQLRFTPGAFTRFTDSLKEQS